MILQRWGPLLLILTILAAYAGVVEAGWVWDDRALVGMNATMEHPTLSVIFGADLWKGTGQGFTPYYRPMMTLSLLLDHQVAPGSPAVAHLQSLLWHVAVVEIVRRLFARHLPAGRALAVAAIVGLHPIQSEAVTWIAARNDLMAAAGLLAALLALEGDRLVLAAVAGLFALLSKESAILLPAIYLCWRFTWRQPIRAAHLIAIAAGLGVALAMRFGATLGELGYLARVPPDHALGPIYLAIDWAGWLSLPWPLTGTTTVYWAPHTPQWIAAVVTTILIAATIWRAPRATALIVFALLALAPATFPTLTTSMVGERYLYLPLVGIAGALGMAAPELPAVLLAPLGIAALVALYVRLPDWASELQLFEAAARRDPNGYTFYMYANELARLHHDREAYVAAERSMAFPPHHPFVCQTLASTGSALLDTPTFLARLPQWEAWGCRKATGFDDATFWRLAIEGRWDLLDPRVPTQANRDRTGRSVAVRGAWFLRDGDWDGLMLSAVRHPEGAADYLDNAMGVYLQARP